MAPILPERPLVIKNRGSKLFETFSIMQYRACLYNVASNRDSNGVGLGTKADGGRLQKKKKRGCTDKPRAGAMAWADARVTVCGIL